MALRSLANDQIKLSAHRVLHFLKTVAVARVKLSVELVQFFHCAALHMKRLRFVFGKIEKGFDFVVVHW